MLLRRMIRTVLLISRHQTETEYRPEARSRRVAGRHTPPLAVALVGLLFFASVGFADSHTWQGALQDGSQISIDPNTNKVTRTAEGISSPLWDGVHSLNNGAVIIVRNGVVIKDVAIIEAQREQERDRLNAACMQLVRKVCGEHNECSDQPACDPARQLLAMEREELNESWAGMVLESSTHCLEGLGNEEFFKSCERSSGEKTPCEKLQLKVCGNQNQCAERESCGAANQLVTMEKQDKFSVPGGFTYATAQCRDVLAKQNDFFELCE
ncbi:MAG: hypothetical protein JAZ05_04490 [Candidatus Thiodiazotropha taylori]|nr:hypothetical protein [Candidatus Thiodiazotropha taylori]MCW4291269.1 hypothetical protein [Candidatus Thiodiazotropha taylori]